MTTLRLALQAACARGLPRPDAQMLLLHGVGRSTTDRAWLLAHDDDSLSPAEQSRFDALVMRRLNGEPVAYITGHKEFYGLDLQVDARVLDPRDDTETLVDWTLEVLANTPHARVVDLGTGSGAVALALQHVRPAWEVLGVDYSIAALDVASENARRLHLGVHFSQGFWLQGCTGLFDAVVSNPPYIADGDPHLGALHHEPLQALASGPDGLQDIRAIINQAGAYLKPGGWLLLEHGYDQATAVRALLRSAGFANEQSRRDLSGIERCSGAQAPRP